MKVNRGVLVVNSKKRKLKEIMPAGVSQERLNFTKAKRMKYNYYVGTSNS